MKICKMQIQQQIQIQNMKKSIQYNSNAHNDKSNRSIISKSSRLTKKNPQEEVREPQLYYFQKNSVGDRVLERTCQSKSQQKKVNHLDKVGKIIQDLMGRHKKAKQKLQKLKQQSQIQHDKQCPFTPKKNMTQRYQIQGDVVRRNQIWLRQKKRKQLQLKQSVTLQNLRQCTFSPSFSSKKTSEVYLRNNHYQNIATRKSYNSKTAQNFSPKKSTRKDFTQAQYEMAKRNLISKMMNVLN